MKLKNGQNERMIMLSQESVNRGKCKGEDDAFLRPVTVKELVEKCGGDFIDEICIAGPLRNPNVFGDVLASPKEFQKRTIKMFQAIGMLT